ncbi:hypothetical protein EV191_11097 [Tamaricihabitans halophyticus]|uniref:Uncharacterized protein n=1 Tax=Tamaricihabitans halophyticus TaxID=1262583 RepID=A0A4R2QIE2_9PSEU|nr:hypothetical protein [Tamaricihabitans halophyticus]TCP48539.1 hypothetical protein EV191_11097 [Tamaricihabitans halophyticus]
MAASDRRAGSASSPAGSSPERLLAQAERLRWLAPELALVFAERVQAIGAASTSGVAAASRERLRLRAEALAVFGLVRMGRRASTVRRALVALDEAEAAGHVDIGWQLRTDLAVCARGVGLPQVGLAGLAPVLGAEDVPAVLRAQALTQLAGCAIPLGYTAELDGVLRTADRACRGEAELDPGTRAILLALVQADVAAYRRQCGDFVGAEQAARAGLGALGETVRPGADAGQASIRLTLELVWALLDRGDVEEAMAASRPVFAEPLRTVAAGASGWLGLALASRVLVPAHEYGRAITMLRDAAYRAERSPVDGLAAALWAELAHVHELADTPQEALACMHRARAAESQHSKLRLAARETLSNAFGEPELDAASVAAIVTDGLGNGSVGTRRRDRESGAFESTAVLADESPFADRMPDGQVADDWSADAPSHDAWSNDDRVSDARTADGGADRWSADSLTADRWAAEDPAASEWEIEPGGGGAVTEFSRTERTRRRRAQWSPSVVRGGGAGASVARRRGRRRTDERDAGAWTGGEEPVQPELSATERWRRSRIAREHDGVEPDGDAAQFGATQFGATQSGADQFGAEQFGVAESVGLSEPVGLSGTSGSRRADTRSADLPDASLAGDDRPSHATGDGSADMRVMLGKVADRYAAKAESRPVDTERETERGIDEIAAELNDILSKMDRQVGGSDGSTGGGNRSGEPALAETSYADAGPADDGPAAGLSAELDLFPAGESESEMDSPAIADSFPDFEPADYASPAGYDSALLPMLRVPEVLAAPESASGQNDSLEPWGWHDDGEAGGTGQAMQGAGRHAVPADDEPGEPAASVGWPDSAGSPDSLDWPESREPVDAVDPPDSGDQPAPGDDESTGRELGLADLLAGALAAYRTTEAGGMADEFGAVDEPAGQPDQPSERSAGDWGVEPSVMDIAPTADGVEPGHFARHGVQGSGYRPTTRRAAPDPMGTQDPIGMDSLGLDRGRHRSAE